MQCDSEGDDDKASTLQISITLNRHGINITTCVRVSKTEVRVQHSSVNYIRTMVPCAIYDSRKLIKTSLQLLGSLRAGKVETERWK